MQLAPQASGNRVLGISPGEVIGGRYEVIRVLGVGGTGAVFEARHQTIGRIVAVKLLLPELSANPVIPQRFLQEARTANEVRHRNIVEVLDFGADNGRLYMVMDYLVGESLADFIVREAPLPPGPIIRALEPIMGALSAAHARGIIHRDVKPQNIFLVKTEGEDEPVPKLIDFGIAKRIVGDDVNLTSTGMILGTPAYMSPEQARAEKNVTHAADQYSLGVILYQALTGRIPYEADTYPALLIQIVSQPPNDIARYRPDLDPRLARAVMRTLERNPSHRFESFAALKEALRPWRDVDAHSAVRTDSMRPGATAGAPTRPDGSPDGAPLDLSNVPTTVQPKPVVPPVTARPAPRPAQSSPLGAIAVLVGVMALSMVALAVHLALRREPSSARPDAAPVARVTDDAVTLRFDVEPPTAEIFLDGTLVGHGHAEVLRPRDGRRLQLRLSAPGYAAVSDVLVTSTDARVSRVLVPLAQTVPAAQRSPSAHAPHAQAPTPAPEPAPTPPARSPPEPPRNHDHPRIDPTNTFGRTSTQ